MDFRIHMTPVYFTEHQVNIYSPVAVLPLTCQDEEGQAAPSASKPKPEDNQISSTGLVMNKREKNFG
jgi:hypothetical protein